jgi:hypothetical protein
VANNEQNNSRQRKQAAPLTPHVIAGQRLHDQPQRPDTVTSAFDAFVNRPEVVALVLRAQPAGDGADEVVGIAMAEVRLLPTVSIERMLCPQ